MFKEALIMKIKHLMILFLVNILIISAGFIVLLGIKLDFSVLKNDEYEILTPSTSDIPHLLWEDNGTVIGNRPNKQYEPQICSDGAGGAIITWNEQNTGFSDIYVQHVNSTGDAQWGDNGTVICNAVNHQQYPQICSDGAGGAIITWQDNRDANLDIYTQCINSTGDVQWGDNGIVICNLGNSQEDPQICSDGLGGAILTWEDNRTGVDYDIYTQRVNSTGDVQWGDNGTVICNLNNYQVDPQICSDGAGGVIITWHDYRTLNLGDIYAQRINSTGDAQWGDNGTIICNAANHQQYPQICSNGVGGAIIVWQDRRSNNNKDIYVQRINSTGVVQWTIDGEPMCTADDNQRNPQICSDGAGGAIITWEDYRSGFNYDIYIQRINSIGDVQSTTNGTIICNADDNQQNPQICSDGVGGAIITWKDDRNGPFDIYAQRVDPSGITSWIGNGTAICTASDDQFAPQICSDGVGSAFITWVDKRVDPTYGDIYAQYVKNDFSPSSNHPNPIITSVGGSETIDWTLYDDSGGGQYRVIANDIYNNDYVWVGWTSWTNNTPFSVSINRTAPGDFSYTIEYYDDQNQYGVPDTVIVTINDAIPTSNHPVDINTSANGSETINWTLYDDFGGGLYRVWANDTNGDYYVWKDWISWTNNIPFSISINRNAPGIFNYTIDYNDSSGQFGISDMVIVNITDGIPTSNHPADIEISVDDTHTIDWILYDDFAGGQYRVLIDGNPGQWSTWTNNSTLNYTIDTSTAGIFNYTIQYYDSNDLFGVPDTVIVTITGISAPTISGYNILILFISASAIALVLTKKFKKDRNHHERYK